MQVAEWTSESGDGVCIEGGNDPNDINHTPIQPMTDLTNGSSFLVRTFQKGFAEYVDQPGLIQNKGASLSSHLDGRFMRLFGTEGNDWLTAPAQSTAKWIVTAGEGNDYVQGTDNNVNLMFGGEGDDYMHGSSTFRDDLIGGAGDDKIFGHGGNDKLKGNDGDDQILGGDGNDKLFGGKGDDQLQGGNGDDLLLAGHGSNMYYGGAGADRFGLMKQHDQNVIGDFNHEEGDQLLIRRRHIDSVEVSFVGNTGANGEPQFWLESDMGLTGIQAKAGTTAADIMGAIKAM